MEQSPQLQNPVERRLLVIAAWTSMLLVSDLPDVVWHTFSGVVPTWLFWGKVGFLALFLGLCLVWKSIRPLWQYACIMFVFYLAFAASTWIGDTPWWQSRFAGEQPSFSIAYLGAYIRDVGVALIVIVGLWLIKKRRSAFFLVKGQLNAPIEPVRWLGIRQGESWRRFGWIFALVAGAVVLVPTMLGIRLSTGMLLRAVPMLPAAVIFAAINAFTEEIYFRTSLLSTLHEVIGTNNTLLINVFFFGIAHYLYGSPPGIVGFLMTGFLAWIMGKSILETKGLVWAWFIHFVPDVVIFVSYAMTWGK
jgi:hypothetical protein